MRFKNRQQAAAELLPYLNKYSNKNVIVLAIPRGGVPIAHYIAKYYHFPLDLLMTKKIGHPAYSEFAIGAVSLEDQLVDESLQIPKSYIDEEIQKIRKTLKEKYKKFMGDHQPASLRNKIVIIVDDGIATGKTILSSIEMLRKQLPEKIVVAVPVAPPETAAMISSQVDDFICLYLPEDFMGVGRHYADFSQVSDEEVIRLLNDIFQHEGNIPS